MRVGITGLLGLALICAAVTEIPSAAAHPIRECGAFDGTSFIPDREMTGAGVYNITTRGVRCGTAHRLVRRWSNRCRRSVCYIGTFRCRTRQTGYELADSRCTTRRSRHYIVRWQSGA